MLSLYLSQKDHLEKLFREAAARQTNIMIDNIMGESIE